MPKRESKVKDWLHCESVPCRNDCGAVIEEVMVEEGTDPPPQVCPACKKRGEQNPNLDIPSDFRELYGDQHKHGVPITLQRKEIERLVSRKEIAPILPGVSKIWIRRKMKKEGK